MKNQWRLIVMMVVILFVVIFSVLNVDPVPVNFMFRRFNSPLIIIIFVALLIGILLSLLVTTGTAAKNSKKLKQADRDRQYAEDSRKQEVVDIRNAYKKEIQRLEEEIQAKNTLITRLEGELAEIKHGPDNREP